MKRVLLFVICVELATMFAFGQKKETRAAVCPKCAIHLQKSPFKNQYGNTTFLPHSNNKTTSVVAGSRIHLPEPHYLISVNQLGNEVIFGGRYFSATEVVLSKNEVEMRFLNDKNFENVFQKNHNKK